MQGEKSLREVGVNSGVARLNLNRLLNVFDGGCGVSDLKRDYAC